MHLHADGDGFTGHGLRDAAVAVEAQSAAAQCATDPHLPIACTDRGRLLGDLAEIRQQQCKRQFGCGIGGRIRMHVGAKQDTMAIAGIHIHMRIDTALRNQFQFGQTLEKIGSNPCSLAKENRRFRLSYPVGKTLRVGLVGDPDGTS